MQRWPLCWQNLSWRGGNLEQCVSHLSNVGGSGFTNSCTLSLKLLYWVQNVLAVKFNCDCISSIFQKTQDFFQDIFWTECLLEWIITIPSMMFAVSFSSSNKFDRTWILSQTALIFFAKSALVVFLIEQSWGYRSQLILLKSFKVDVTCMLHGQQTAKQYFGRTHERLLLVHFIGFCISTNVCVFVLGSGYEKAYWFASPR